MPTDLYVSSLELKSNDQCSHHQLLDICLESVGLFLTAITSDSYTFGMQCVRHIILQEKYLWSIIVHEELDNLCTFGQKMK